MFKHWIIHWKFGWLPKSPHPCTIAIYFCTWNLVLCLHFELKLQWLSSTYSIDLLLIYWHGFFTLRLGKHFCWGDWLCLVIFWSSTEDAGFLKMCLKYAAESCHWKLLSVNWFLLPLLSLYWDWFSLANMCMHHLYASFVKVVLISQPVLRIATLIKHTWLSSSKRMRKLQIKKLNAKQNSFGHDTHYFLLLMWVVLLD